MRRTPQRGMEHSDWMQQQEQPEAQPPGPRDRARQRLLKDVNRMLDNVDDTQDPVVRKALLQQAAMECIKLCLSMDNE